MKLFHSRSTSYISLCMHNVLYSLLLILELKYGTFYFILTYFLEDISSSANL